MAKEMLKLVQEVAPSLFKNAGPTCKTLGICMENNMQCDEMMLVKFKLDFLVQKHQEDYR